MVSGLAWSPDSTRLAVAQSDNIVFVYRLGLDWADKKSICNKFTSSSAVTSVCWPAALANEVVFGTAEGKVRLGNCKSNKSATLYTGEGVSYVTCMAPGPDGRSCLVSHADGSLYQVVWDEQGGNPGHTRLCGHSCPPTALAWGKAVVAAGADGRVCFYDAQDGTLQRTFERSRPGGGACDWCCASISPSGEAVALGTYGGPALFALQAGGEGGVAASGKGARAANREWVEVPVANTPVPGLHTVTCVAWKPDGSKVAVGAVSGTAGLWDACLRRTRWKEKLEFTYVSLSAVIVKRLSTGVRIVLRSSFGHEIRRVKVVTGMAATGQAAGERYIAAYTPATLLLGDLDSCKLSEVPWSSVGPSVGAGDRFLFGLHPSVVLVARAGEVTLVEYGRTDAVATVRTEHVSRSTLSVRIQPPVDSSLGATPGLKRVAYLLDREHVRILDLDSTGAGAAGAGHVHCTIAHDSRITWLDMSASGRLLLFQDQRKRLCLVELAAGQGGGLGSTAGAAPAAAPAVNESERKTTLLPFSTYAAWVPGTDAVIAQRRGQLCCWYNPRAAGAVSTWDIGAGDVSTVVREGARVEVLVEEHGGMTQTAYALDGAYIGFAAAMESGDLGAASAMLESLPTPPGASGLPPQHAAMWSQLSEQALARNELGVAQRAAAALGATTRAAYLAKTMKIARLAAEKAGGNGMEHWMVRARLAQLHGDVAGAEGIFVQAGRVDAAIDMYQTLQRWEDALALADSHGHPQASALRQQYIDHLLATGQEERAGAMKEGQGDKLGAIELYLQGGAPARALSVVLSSPTVSIPRPVMDRIVQALAAFELHEKAGMLWERLGNAEQALQAYCQGKAWKHAVDIARRSFPSRVQELERSWGDWCMSQGNPDGAVGHYMEAGAYAQAVAAALDARQWLKATQLLTESVRDEPAIARPAWLRLAKHHAGRGAFEEAEKCYKQAGEGKAAVDMYITAGKHDSAYKAARSSMAEGEVTSLFVDTAKRMADVGNTRGAEKLYCQVRAYDAAIAMYRAARQWEAMMRVVLQYRPDLAREARLHAAKELAGEGNARAAERYWTDAGDWEAAVRAYTGSGQWEDALRVARSHGPKDAAAELAYRHASGLDPEARQALLARLGMQDVAIDIACGQAQWEQALSMASRIGRDKELYVLYKRGMAAEDQGDFSAAEQYFLQAEKPREAIDMHVHNKEWDAALRVAQDYDPGAIQDIMVAQGHAAVAAGALDRAEGLFCDARRPDLAIEAYLTGKAWADALRVAKRHTPAKVAELQARVKQAIDDGAAPSSSGSSGPAAITVPGSAAPSPDRRSRSLQGLPGQSAVQPSAPVGTAAAPAPTSATSDHLSLARSFQEAGELSLAVDSFLRVSPPAYDTQTSVAAWAQAVRVAVQIDRSRHAAVADEVAARLYDLGEHEAAGDAWRDAGSADKAARAYAHAGLWDKARAAAGQATGPVREEIERAYNAALLSHGDPEALVYAGQLYAAIGVYQQRGDVARVLEVAARGGPALLAKHLYPVVENTLQGTDLGSPEQKWARSIRAIHLLLQHGCPPILAELSLYRALVAMLWDGSMGQGSCAPAAAWHDARDVLYRYASGVRKSGGEAALLAELDKLLLGVHYASMRVRAQEAGNSELYARLSLALLRFVGPVVPAERLFYEAGCAARDAGWKSAAVVLFNRFIDLSEAAEDGAKNGKGLDNNDFKDTGIPGPAEMLLPAGGKGLFVPAKARETIKDWVLAITMDTRMEHSLPRRPCLSCSEPVYEAALGCSSCKASFPSCIVSGYPIPASQMVSCGSCGSKASKSAWNVIAGKTKACPWCGVAAAAAM